MIDIKVEIANRLKLQFTKSEMMDSCKDIVVPRFFNLYLDGIIESQDIIDDEFKSHWLKLLSDVKLNEGQISEIILACFGMYSGTKKSLIRINTNREVRKDCVLIWAATPTKLQMGLLKKLFVRTLKNTNYHIEVVNSDHTSNKDVEEQLDKLIEKLKKRGKRLIILSNIMGSRSVSVSQIETTFIWYDAGSVDTTTQKLSRVFTTGELWGGEQKKYGNILSFSFDPNREESGPMDDYLVNEAEKIPNEELGDSLKRVLNSMYIWEVDEHGLIIEMNEVKRDMYIERLISSSSLLNVAEAGVNPFAIKDDDDVFNVLISTGAKQKPLGIDRGNVTTSVGGSDRSNNINEPNDELESIRLRRVVLKTIVQNVLTLSEINNCESDSMTGSLTGITNRGLDYELITEVGVGSKTIQKWLDDGAFNEKLMNTIIASYNKSENKHEINDKELVCFI